MFDLSLLSSIADEDLPLLQTMAVYNEALSQPDLLALLKLSPVLLNRVNTPEHLNTRFAELSVSTLIQKTDDQNYKINPDARMAILLGLQQAGLLTKWIPNIRVLFKNQHQYNQWRTFASSFCHREMLFSAFMGEYQELLTWRSKFYHTYNYQDGLPAEEFFHCTEGIALFATLGEREQCVFLNDILPNVMWYLQRFPSVYEYACEFISRAKNNDSDLINEVCWQAILRGDMPTFSRIIHNASPQFQTKMRIIPAILEGRIADAVELIEVYTKAVKAETGIRKLHLPNIFGLFCTVALIGKNDTASLKRAKEQIGEALKYNSSIFYECLDPFITHLQQGTACTQRHFPPPLEKNVLVLFIAIALYWQESPYTIEMKDHILETRAIAQRGGYHWIVAELDVLLHTQYAMPPLLPGWHTQHQLTPLTFALRREAAWQRALTALTQLKPLTVEEQITSDQRLSWLLDVDRHRIKFEVREQKRSAKGAWSRGRTVALKRLAQEPDSVHGLTDQDKRLLTHLHKNHQSYLLEYIFDQDKALPAMIGHPAVYWQEAPDIRIDIVKGDIALQLNETKQLISLQLNPPVLAHENMVWRKQTPTRLAVYTVSPEIKQIASILGTGLTMPNSAKAQLVQVIAAIAPHLPIHSDLPEFAAHLTSVEANPILYAHLLPLQEGLRMQLLVQPLSDGMWLPPGKGSANVLGERDGIAVQASRNLPQEKKQLEEVVQACPSFAQAEQNDDEWELIHPETCLELLTELKALPETTLQLVWPEGERFRLRGQRSLQQMRFSIKKQGEWFVAGGEITLDDGRILALRELLQLAANAPGRFLKLGENDYLALTENFRQRLAELNAVSEPGSKDGVRINRLATTALAELANEVGELKADSAWREQVKKLDSLADFTPQLPSTLQAELRDYQLDGYHWLARLAHWGVGACLADDMGLGKTIQALALLLNRAPQGPALVVAPISVAMNWQAEIIRFAPTLKVRAYHNNRSLADLGAFDIVIASYGMLQSDSELFSAQHWHSVVLDEAQVIKNAATKRSQAAMALNADFKMIASGTPVENHLGELWNLFRFINPGLLGSKERFIERFANPIERGEKAPRQHLKKLIQPFILRRTKTQVLRELPSRTEITLQVKLSDEERHLYEALRQEAIDKINNMEPSEGKAMQVLAQITRLRRFCCNPKLVLKNASVAGSKLAVFAHVVEELLENRHKALVFSQFVDHLAIVREWLEQKGIFYQYLDGSTPPMERKKRVDAFQAGEGDVFLISLKAGGTGLNLTAADYVIHLDPWWNPAVEDQASDRAHRMGQVRPVTIYRLVTEATIEEKILALHAEKRDLADSLLDGGDAAGKMDTAALLRLLKESM